MSSSPVEPRRESAVDPLKTLDEIAASLQGPHDSSDGTPPRRLVQDFVPMLEGLEWKLSSCFWATQGLQPFVDGQVPYLIHNNGYYATCAADLFFASCRAAGADLPPRIEVLEVGAGLGLFAMQWMDRFHELCQESGADYYDRLTYHVTDGSALTVGQWEDKSIYARHAGHALTACCDATRPHTFTDPTDHDRRFGELRAVFANYVMDSLPATVLRRRDGRVDELHVRTWLRAEYETRPRAADEPTAEQIVELAPSRSLEDLTRLLPLVNQLEFETTFRPASMETDTYAQHAETLFHEDEPTVLNHGALRCIDAWLEQLGPTGFMLISDYGARTHLELRELAKVNRFGASVSTCLHLGVLEKHVERTGRHWVAPANEQPRSIYPRLIHADAAGETVKAFLEHYADGKYDEISELVVTATRHINGGRHDEAIACFRAALAGCPHDWSALGHTAQFLTQQLHKPDEARLLALRALEINPSSSAFLWNTLGNCDFLLGDHEQAQENYQKALGIDATDAQTHLNLAYSHEHYGRLDSALLSIARGLQYDIGRYQAALLQKQQQLLDEKGRRRAERLDRLSQRSERFTRAD